MPDTPTRTSYELFVGHHLSPATLATFPVALVPTAVPRKSVHRLRVGADSDIAEIVRRLTERDVELLDIRRCPEWPGRRPARVPGRDVAPVEQAGSGVVVPLPRSRPIDPGLPEPAETGGQEVVPLSPSRPSDAGARRGPRRRRRSARG